MNMFLGSIFEGLAKEIFEKSGFIVDDKSKQDRCFDFIAKTEKRVFFVEVKAAATLEYQNIAIIDRTIQRVLSASEMGGAIPVLMVFSVIAENSKRKLKEEYNSLIVMDLCNILFVTKGTDLQKDLISFLPFSVDRVEYKPGEIDLGWVEHSCLEDELIVKLDKCIEGRKGAYKFEDICYEIMKYVLFDDLALWKRQKYSNNNIFRFDLMCRIKDNTNKTIWTMIESFFNSKYIIFEFKNYKDEITQKEVFSTSRYLYNKALRNVAIIIARNGFDENSLWAAKGCLREDGKLILLLSIDDMKKMIEIKKEQQEPTEVLLNKIDELLMCLEK